MFSAGPSGLQNAPITKFILITVVGSTLLINYISARSKSTKAQDIHTLSYSPINLILNQIYFKSLSELITGSLLIYSYRIFERIYGSSKYSLFVISTILLSTFVQLGYIVLFKKNEFYGPTTLIFACLVLFYKDIPPIHWFRVFGFPLNDKFLTYIMAAQLMLTNTGNLPSCISGVLAGILYYTDFIGLKSRRRIPSSLTQFCQRWIAPFLATASRPTSLRPLIEHQQMMQQTHRNNNNNQGGFFPQQQAVPPSQENIAMLESMGFPRNMAIEALQYTNNNLNDATNFLLGGH